MLTILSFAALLFSMFLVQLGSGVLGPLDALAGGMRGFSTEQIGLLGSAHFAGFLLGCWATPRLIGHVGHARGFAAAGAVGAIGALLHPVLEGPAFWAALRVLTGLSLAAAYTIVESWLQAKLENRNRGRIFGVYRVVELSGQIAAQGLVALLDPASYVAYNVVAVFCCACLLPLMLSRSVPPAISEAPRLRPIAAFRIAPSAALAMVVSGATSAAFRMVGPVFGVERGLEKGEIALFLVASMVGAALAQVPVGWLADRGDRRRVLLGLSLGTIGVSLWLGLGAEGAGALILWSGVFGALAWPIFSVAGAHANDRAPPAFAVELNAAIMLFFSVGAIASPLLTAALIGAMGPKGLFLFIAAAHLALILVTLYRMARRAAAPRATPYRYLPRTSLLLARLIGRDAQGRNGARRGPEHEAPAVAPARKKAEDP